MTATCDQNQNISFRLINQANEILVSFRHSLRIFLHKKNQKSHISHFLKFIYSEKATKFCEIFTLLLSYVVPIKSKVKIFQNFVAFSKYMKFMQPDKEINVLEIFGRLGGSSIAVVGSCSCNITHNSHNCV